MLNTFLSSFLTTFIHISVDAIPFFFVGTFFGALLNTKIKPSLSKKFLNNNISSVINACFFGAVIPGCSCATAPLAKSMRLKGAKLGTTTAFLMVSPLLSPHTLILTYGLLGAPFAFGRLGLSLIWGIAFGILFNLLEQKKITGFHNIQPQPEQETHAHTHSLSFWSQFFTISKDLGTYFVIGLIIASALMAINPTQLIDLLNNYPTYSYITAAFIGIPMYVCEGEEIPLTLGLLNLGLAKGPAFTFLLGSIGTCIPTIIMGKKIIGFRPIFIYVIGWFIFAIASGVLISLF